MQIELYDLQMGEFAMKCRKTGIYLIILVFGMIITGCSFGKEKEEVSSYSFELHFYKDEYEEAYSHYEKNLVIGENNSKILITGLTSSGTIEVSIADNVSKDVLYNFTVDGVLQETVSLEDISTSQEWTVSIDCSEDTEGEIVVSLE